jgi:hypothetical protein
MAACFTPKARPRCPSSTDLVRSEEEVHGRLHRPVREAAADQEPEEPGDRGGREAGTDQRERGESDGDEQDPERADPLGHATRPDGAERRGPDVRRHRASDGCGPDVEVRLELDGERTGQEHREHPGRGQGDGKGGGQGDGQGDASKLAT